MKLLFFLFFISSVVYSKALVYKVTKANQSIYIGGTIHVLSSADYPLPKEYFYAFEQSDTLVLETDLAKTETQEFAASLMKILSYPPNKTLRDDLNVSTYIALKKHCLKHGIAFESLEHFKVAMSVMNILMQSLKEANVNAMGVDKYFYIQAKESHKPLAFLESVESQIMLLGSMGKDQENELILSTLQDANGLKDEMYTLIKHWRKADTNALVDEMITPLQKDYPLLYQEILVNRNQAWMHKIVAMFKTKKIEYILVGAMHLIGKDGLINKLRKQGYSCTLVDIK